MNPTWILPVVLCMTAVNGRAQIFGPESLTGAALGGIAGAVIGHNSGRHGGEGAAIGAGVGLVPGALAGEERRREAADYGPSPVYIEPAPRPNYVVGGAVLGGVAGAVIGHNNGRHAAEGAAIGVASGLVLGTLAEQSARRAEAYRTPAVVVSTAPAPAVVPVSSASQAPAEIQPPPPIIRSTWQSQAQSPEQSSSSMAPANGLFGR